MNLILFLAILPSSNAALIPSPSEIAVWALEDAVTQHTAGHNVSGYRYIWLHHKDEKDCIDAARVIDLAPINMVLSKSSNLIISHRVHTRLMRIDLLRLGVDDVRSKKLINTWEKLKDIDHYLTADENDLSVEFVEVITATPIKVEKTTIRLANVGEKLELGKSSNDPAWTSVKIDGKTAYIAASSVKSPKKAAKRSIGPQCGTAGIELAKLLSTDIPVIRGDVLIRGAMQGDFVLRPLGQEGGLYYEFLQIDKSTEKDKTDLQVFLEAFGADFDESQRLRSDVGSILIRSGVTGSSRVLTAFRGRSGRPGATDGIVYGTFDNKDGDEFNQELDPLEDVLGFKHQASEWIAPLPNGLHAYGLFAGNFNGQNQERQDFAPDDVAVDRSIPAPHSSRLVVGMCWRCHNLTEEENGLKSAGNDLARIFEKGRDIVTKREDADTIASRYSGSFQKVVDGSRDAFAGAVYRVTRDPAHNLEGMTSFEAFGLLSKIHNDYWYELVTPEKALLDLGIIPVNEILPENELARLVDVKDIGESGALIHLVTGNSINRWNWERIYPEVILRVQETLAKEAERVPNEKQVAK